MTSSRIPRQLQRVSLLLVAGLLAACANTAPPSSSPNSPPGEQRNPLPDLLSAPHAAPAPRAPEAQASSTAVSTAAEVLLEDKLRPGALVDLNEASAKADLWGRLRGGFAMAELDDEWVKKAETWYGARPDYVQRMTERGSRYLFHIIEEVEKRGMPAELALLPFIESAFVTDAMSRTKASGMWQFMPATGRDFDLKQNIFRDDRRDVLASTRAALDYLGRLHKMFGDWHLALAAYNWGQGNVAKAIARNEKLGLPTDYASLKMPEETRYYVPKLQAVKNIVLEPQRYGLALPALSNHPYFLSVDIERDMDVDVAARLAGISEEEFRQFNPQMNKPVILATGTAQVLLPYDNASAFAVKLAAHRGPLASWTAWVVPRTMKPADAAKQVGMSETALRDINNIPPKMLVNKGSTLLVPRAAHRVEDVSEHLADNASISLAPDVPPLRRVVLKADKGDTVASVAARWRVSRAQLAQWNKVSTKASFKPGQQVVLYSTTSTTLAKTASSTTAKPAVKAEASSKPAKSKGGRSVVVANAKPTANLARR